MLLIVCSACGARREVPAGYLGCEIRCPNCRALIRVPGTIDPNQPAVAITLEQAPARASSTMAHAIRPEPVRDPSRWPSFLSLAFITACFLGAGALLRARPADSASAPERLIDRIHAHIRAQKLNQAGRALAQLKPGIDALRDTERRGGLERRALILRKILNAAKALRAGQTAQAQAAAKRADALLKAAKKRQNVPAGSEGAAPLADSKRLAGALAEIQAAIYFAKLLDRAEAAARADAMKAAFDELKQAESQLPAGRLSGTYRRQMQGRIDRLGRDFLARVGKGIDDQLKRTEENLRDGNVEASTTQLASIRREVNGFGFLNGAQRGSLLAKVDKFEARLPEIAQAAINERLAKADGLYRDGQLEPFRETLTALKEQTGALFSLLSAAGRQAFKLPLDALQDRLNEYEQIRQVIQNVNWDFDAARKKLRELEAQLPALKEQFPNAPNRKPLRAFIEQKREQLSAQENEALLNWVRGGVADDDDGPPLAALGRFIARNDPSVSYKPPPGNARERKITLERGGDTFSLDVMRSYNRQRRLRMVAHIGTGGAVFQMPLWKVFRWPSLMLARAGASAEELRKAGLEAANGAIWNLELGSPFLAPMRRVEDRLVMVYSGKSLAATWHLDRKEKRERWGKMEAFKEATERLARGIENDPTLAEKVRATLAFVVRASAGGAEQRDYLDQPFVQKVLDRGYIEAVVPEAAERLRAPIREYRQAYRQLAELRPLITATARAGDGELEIVNFVSLSGRSIWRLRDARRPQQTTFALGLPLDHSFTSLQLYNDFDGELAAWPAGRTPDRVRVMHPVLGELASYDLKTKAFAANTEKWNLAVKLDEHLGIDKFYAGGLWRLEPHVVVLDDQGDTRALIVGNGPNGRLDMPPGGFFGNEKQRRIQQLAFTKRVAQVLRTPGTMTLYFQYFVQYCLDSPVPSRPNLLGSSAHTGDIHQDVHQFLDRHLGGRFVCDCDDLAEFFKEVTRLQGETSYVCGVPAHATCGWIEDRGANPPDDRGRYAMYFLDTGPPRRFFDDKLNSVIEKGYRSYDFNGTLQFNPDSVLFLFRFAGEPTRTPYVLGARMFVDDEYGQLLKRVQEMWHFHTYLQGIDVMKSVCADDPIPPNCFELSGLYRATRQFDKAREWRRKGMEQLQDGDTISRLDSLIDLAMLYELDQLKPDARKMLDEAAVKLKQLEGDRKNSRRFRAMRFVVAARYAALDAPVTGWNVIRNDAKQIIADGELSDTNAFVLTDIHRRLQDLNRAGKKKAGNTPIHNLQRTADELAPLLLHHFESDHFQEDDVLAQVLSKYATLAHFYAGKYGRQRVLDELLLKGGYPAKDSRRHEERPWDDPETEAQDWQWIRLSLGSYRAEINRALDPNQSLSDKNRALALKLIAAAERAVKQGREHGSLTRAEWSLLGLRIIRSALRGREGLKEFEAVLQEVQKLDWGPVYKLAAATVGSAARFVNPEQFKQQMALFRQYIPTKPQYFQAAYDAFRVDAFEAAKIAADVAAERYAEDVTQQKERDFLRDLVDEKKQDLAARKAKQSAQKNRSPAAVSP